MRSCSCASGGLQLIRDTRLRQAAEADTADSSSTALVVASSKPKPGPLVKKVSKPAPDDSLSFSTLDFSTADLLRAQKAGIKPSALDKKKRNRHDLPKDANAALEVLAGRKARLEALDPEQREKREEKDRWEKVGLKAEGEKVRDDEKKLKKMAKRQEKIKSKSAKAWSVPLLRLYAHSHSLLRRPLPPFVDWWCECRWLTILASGDAGRRGRRR